MAPDTHPFARVAAAILLGMVPPLLLYAVVLAGLDNWRVTGVLALFAVASVTVVGVPLAWLALRARGATVWRWGLVGAGGALLAFMLCGFLVFGSRFPSLFEGPFAANVTLTFVELVVLFGVLTGVSGWWVLRRLDRR